MADATTIAEFVTRLEAYLGQVTGGAVRLSNVTRLTGGASRDTWSLDATIEGGSEAGAHRLILRPESRLRKVTAGSIVEEILNEVSVPVIQAEEEPEHPLR